MISIRTMPFVARLRKSLALVSIIMILSLPVHAVADEPALKKAVLIPHWVPQAQFAGYYVALEKGIYRAHGIDLTIMPGGPDNSPLDMLKDGKADFATHWLTSGIKARDKGAPVLNIAQTMPKSALMLVAKKSNGIREPRDMEGKKVGLWADFQLQPLAFFKKYNLNVNIVRQSYSVNLFLRDGVDVVCAMLYNEYHTILNAGLNPEELTVFMFHEYGLNFPEDGIYTLEDTIKRDPELCKSFVRASRLGWQYAFEHPEEAIDLVMKNLEKEHIPATRVHQRWMLDRMKDLMLFGDGSIMGPMSEEDYYRVADALHSGGFIENIPDLNDFHKECGDNYEK